MADNVAVQFTGITSDISLILTHTTFIEQHNCGFTLDTLPLHIQPDMSVLKLLMPSVPQISLNLVLGRQWGLPEAKAISSTAYVLKAIIDLLSSYNYDTNCVLSPLLSWIGGLNSTQLQYAPLAVFRAMGNIVYNCPDFLSFSTIPDASGAQYFTDVKTDITGMLQSMQGMGNALIAEDNNINKVIAYFDNNHNGFIVGEPVTSDTIHFGCYITDSTQTVNCVEPLLHD
ncbi:MAG: hypothetical protein M1381_08735 [Deltaproteobacteria bacterium]|nr:hypothetical protein [Deltaproteobacteria bacterium]